MTLSPRVPIQVTKRDGGKLTLNGEPGKPLLRTLTRSNLIRKPTCQGVLKCSECHVYVNRTDGLHPDEALALVNLENYEPDSRLACRVKITPEDAGMTVVIAPEEPK